MSSPASESTITPPQPQRSNGCTRCCRTYGVGALIITLCAVLAIGAVGLMIAGNKFPGLHLSVGSRVAIGVVITPAAIVAVGALGCLSYTGYCYAADYFQKRCPS